MQGLSIINSIRAATMNSMNNQISIMANLASYGNHNGEDANMIQCVNDLTDYIICEESICGTDEDPGNDICVK